MFVISREADIAAGNPIQKKIDNLSAESFATNDFTTVLYFKTALKDTDKGFFLPNKSPGNRDRKFICYELNHQVKSGVK